MPVANIEIKSRTPFVGGQAFGDAGAYEQLNGVVRFAVDPESAANETIADIKLAPRDGQGLVEFSSDFRILAPVDQGLGNRRLFLDVLNRGKNSAFKNFLTAHRTMPPRVLPTPVRLFDAAGVYRGLVRLAVRRARGSRHHGDPGARCRRRCRTDFREDRNDFSDQLPDSGPTPFQSGAPGVPGRTTWRTGTR